MEINWTNVDAAIDYLTALRDAKNEMDAYNAILNTPPAEPVDMEKLKASTQNKILANGARKAEILGTISTSPIIDITKMIDIGVKADVAEAIDKGRNDLRAWAKGLSA